MIIKSFTGPTVAAALKVVRDEMGGDAVVLKTRVLAPDETTAPDKLVEVTACIDESVLTPGIMSEFLRKETIGPKDFLKTPLNDISAKTLRDNGNPSDFAAGLERKLDSILHGHKETGPLMDLAPSVRTIYLDMLDADVPSEIARQLIEKINQNNVSEIKIREAAVVSLTSYLSSFVPEEIKFEPGMRIIFAGRSGSGKTSALAKLAAQLVIGSKLKVTLSSLDDMKVSAYEEIGSYADILNLPAAMFDELADRQNNDSVILIDTPALPTDPERRGKLLKRIRAVKPDCTFLVFSACSRSRDLLDAVNHFESLSPDYLIAGHLDETERWGTIFTMVGFLEKPLAYLATSPGGIGRMERPEPEKIAHHILKLEAPDENE